MEKIPAQKQAKPLPRNKKIMLVIEDVGHGTGFKFEMQGDIERLDGKTPVGEYTAAEFWGVQLFNLCNDHMKRHGDLGQTGGPDA